MIGKKGPRRRPIIETAMAFWTMEGTNQMVSSRLWRLGRMTVSKEQGKQGREGLHDGQDGVDVDDSLFAYPSVHADQGDAA